MNKNDELIYAVQESTGLLPVEFVTGQPGPSMLWSLIAKVSSRPICEAIELSEIDSAWVNVCRQLRILGSTGEVLLSVGGYGDLDWLKTKCPTPESLLGLRAPGMPDPEFIVIDLDRTVMAAVTTEESGHWIFAGRAVNGTWSLLNSDCIDS